MLQPKKTWWDDGKPEKSFKKSLVKGVLDGLKSWLPAEVNGSKYKRGEFPDEETTKVFKNLKKSMRPGKFSAFLDIYYERGAPRISDTKAPLLPRILASPGGTYNAYNHKITVEDLWLEDKSDVLLSELAHSGKDRIKDAKQWLSNDLPAYIREYLDKDEFNFKSPYITKGTLEYDTHSIIEPELKKYIKDKDSIYFDKYLKRIDSILNLAKNDPKEMTKWFGQEKGYFDKKEKEWEKNYLKLPDTLKTYNEFQNGGATKKLWYDE